MANVIGPTSAVDFSQMARRAEQNLRAPHATSETKESSRNAMTPFAEHLSEFVQQVDETQKTADQMMDDYSNGKQNDLHGTMIAAEKANVTLHLLGSVRNKMLEAYREVMRMGA